MKMYLWNSELLRQYSDGDLIAIAESVDHARQLLRAGLDAWIKENRAMEWYEAFEPYKGDEPDKTGYDRLVAKFERDISIEPTEHVTLWMNGSE